jgi:methyl halide transferase
VILCYFAASLSHFWQRLALSNHKITTMEEEYWETRWQHAQTGWDLGAISPPLKDYIDSLIDKNQRILIPGCGNSYEAEYLLAQGFSNITVIDIAPTLTDKLYVKLSDFVLRGKLQIVCGDFFTHQGEYELILEQTFFCALTPNLRKDYAQHMFSLLAPQGKLVGLLFNKAFEGGPPFGGNVAEYETYFKPLFSSVSIEPCNTSAAPRAGSEVFITLAKN